MASKKKNASAPKSKAYNTSEYKGHTLIVLGDPANRFESFQFGPRKAQMILDHLEQIKAFAKDHPAVS